jgi:hypothetical protein
VFFVQTVLGIPKDKKEISITVKLDHADKMALERGMRKVGETNASSFIRRIIHENGK